MKLIKIDYFSFLISIILHICLVFIFISIIPNNPKEAAQTYVEIGFNGLTETNSTGFKSSLPALDRRAEKSLRDKKHVTEITKREKSKDVENVKSPDLKKNPDISDEKAKQNDAQSGSGTNSGNTNQDGAAGGDGNSGSGSGPAKIGININSDIYYVAVDQMPVPYGGIESITSKAFYPSEAEKINLTGTVYVLAYIDENGYVKKTSVIKGIGYGCDSSAERAVKETRFKPGKNQGRPVKVQMTIAVKFGTEKLR